MANTLSRLKGAIKPPIQRVARRVFRLDPGYEFKPAPSIRRQSLTFTFRGHPIAMTADHTTPLYDTIAEIVDHDCYQLEFVDFSHSANALVLDVGAHIGTASVVLSKLHAGTILCFEPIPGNCQWLRENLAANHAGKAVVVEAAMADRDGSIEFAVDPNSSVAGHRAGIVAADPHAFSQTLRVKSVTLRSALANYPNSEIFLVKADCEGGEYGLVDQLDSDLLPRVRHMTFEVHDLDRARNVTALKAKLQRLGFQVRYKPELHNRFGLHHLLASRRTS